jgi:hypothetical protein
MGADGSGMNSPAPSTLPTPDGLIRSIRSSVFVDSVHRDSDVNDLGHQVFWTVYVSNSTNSYHRH